MNRLILSLLALLTGVVAQVSPVQAAVRGGGGAEIGAVEVTRGVARLARSGRAQPLPSQVALRQSRTVKAEPLAEFRLAPLAVRIGIDRARQ